MYSNLKVQMSAAGFYIGRTYGPHCEPGSRESGYYKTREQAETILSNGTFLVRICSENDYAYTNGALPDIRNKSIYDEEVKKYNDDKTK